MNRKSLLFGLVLLLVASLNIACDDHSDETDLEPTYIKPEGIISSPGITLDKHMFCDATENCDFDTKLEILNGVGDILASFDMNYGYQFDRLYLEDEDLSKTFDSLKNYDDFISYLEENAKDLAKLNFQISVRAKLLDQSNVIRTQEFITNQSKGDFFKSPSALNSQDFTFVEISFHTIAAREIECSERATFAETYNQIKVRMPGNLSCESKDHTRSVSIENCAILLSADDNGGGLKIISATLFEIPFQKARVEYEFDNQDFYDYYYTLVGFNSSIYPTKYWQDAGNFNDSQRSFGVYVGEKGFLSSETPNIFWAYSSDKGLHSVKVKSFSSGMYYTRKACYTNGSVFVEMTLPSSSSWDQL